MATQKKIAQHLDLSERRIGDVLRKLGLPTKGCDLDLARVSYIKYLRETAAGRSSENSNYDLVEERARLAHHQANKTALEEEILSGKLITSDLVEQVWSDMIVAFRSRMLSIPSRISTYTASSSDPLEISKLTKDGIIEALQELSEYNPEQYTQH